MKRDQLTNTIISSNNNNTVQSCVLQKNLRSMTKFINADYSLATNSFN